MSDHQQLVSDPTATKRGQWLLPAFLAPAWIYVAIRAYRIGITHDESISFGITHGQRTFVGDVANNHWLNTLAMKVAERLFGESAFAIRLPNVIAFGVYSSAVTAIIWSRLRTAQIAGILLLVANPFVLEFFGLARGYGLELAFAAVALAALVVDRSLGALKAVAVTAGVLSFYSNFGALNVVLAIYGALLITALVRRERRILVTGLIAAGLAAMVRGLLHVKWMQDAGALYDGGHRGFVPDTIGSVLARTGLKPGLLPFGEIVVVVVALLCAARASTRRRWDAPAMACVVLFAAVAGQVAESVMFGSLWPQDRSALIFLVPFAAAVALTLDDIRTNAGWAPVLVGGLMIGHNFAGAANLAYTTMWRYDETSQTVMDAVVDLEHKVGHPDRPWVLLAGFPRSQALEFYRISWSIDYIARITREPVTGSGDLFYVDSSEPWKAGTVLVASFPATQTELRAEEAVAEPA